MDDLHELNDEFSRQLKSFSRNLLILLNEAKVVGIEPELSTLSRGTSILKQNLNNFINIMASSKKDQNAVDCEKEALRTKYENLQKEWDSQQEHLGRLQGDIYAVRNQLRVQSAFCSSLGSTLGNLLWKVSRLPSAVDLLLASNKLPDLFTMVTGSIASFIETYGESGLPEVFSDETQFILSMVGVIANIAAAPEGRNLLVSEESGNELLEQLVNSLSSVPLGTGEPLLRIIFMVLYNISIHEGGLTLLQDKRPLLVTTAEMIACDRSPQLRSIALRLLDSLTYAYPNIAVYNLHKALIPLNKLKSLSKDPDVEMRGYANSILGNLQKAEEQFNLGNLTSFRGHPQESIRPSIS